MIGGGCWALEVAMTFADAVKLPDAEYRKHAKKLERRDRIYTALGAVLGVAFICIAVVSMAKA